MRISTLLGFCESDEARSRLREESMDSIAMRDAVEEGEEVMVPGLSEEGKLILSALLHRFNSNGKFHRYIRIFKH